VLAYAGWLRLVWLTVLASCVSALVLGAVELVADLGVTRRWTSIAMCQKGLKTLRV